MDEKHSKRLFPAQLLILRKEPMDSAKEIQKLIEKFNAGSKSDYQFLLILVEAFDLGVKSAQEEKEPE